MSSFACNASRRRVAFTLGMLGMLSAAACQSAEITCPADLGWRWTPANATIDVGEQFQARLTLFGCGGTKTLTDTLTYTSSNPAVATVNLNTGIVIGHSTGVASIAAEGRKYQVIPPLQVRVR